MEMTGDKHLEKRSYFKAQPYACYIGGVNQKFCQLG